MSRLSGPAARTQRACAPLLSAPRASPSCGRVTSLARRKGISWTTAFVIWAAPDVTTPIATSESRGSTAGRRRAHDCFRGEGPSDAPPSPLAKCHAHNRQLRHAPDDSLGHTCRGCSRPGQERRSGTGLPSSRWRAGVSRPSARRLVLVPSEREGPDARYACRRRSVRPTQCVAALVARREPSADREVLAACVAATRA